MLQPTRTEPANQPFSVAASDALFLLQQNPSHSPLAITNASLMHIVDAFMHTTGSCVSTNAAIHAQEPSALSSINKLFHRHECLTRTTVCSTQHCPPTDAVPITRIVVKSVNPE